jgi:hypothetical protein
MRRIFPAVFLSALLVTIPTVFAQRAGTMHSAGFGGHAASHSFGGFSGSFARPSGLTARGFATAPRMAFTTPSRSVFPASRASYGTNPASRRPDGANGRYRPHYRGYANYGGYPYYANSWELLPWDLGYPDFTGYGSGYNSGSNESGSDPAQDPALAQTDDGYRQGYGEPVYQSSAAISSTPIASEPELTLIFNDGHREGIRNYVLTSETVIVLDQAASGRQQRVPLAELNLPATERAAQQAGLDFTPPA